MAKTAKTPSRDNAKACAALAYVLIGIVWYFVDDTMKDDALATFHVKQGIVLLIAAIVVDVVGTIIPFIGWYIVLPLGGALVLIWAILGIISALEGKQQELFFIGQFAKKLPF
jgi:uncharacterized membrane protein